MPSKKKSTALAVIDNFAITQFDADDFRETMRENFGDDTLSPRDLSRVKIPAGGGVHWLVPSLDDDDGEMSKEVEGVVVAQRNTRVFWEKDLDEGGGSQPPDCFSTDGRTGIGGPGGNCKTCPHAQFGSKEGGKGQRCKQVKEIYLLTPENVLPMVIALPPTSIGNFKKYAAKLTMAGKPLHSRLTTFSLAETKNDAGITYSKAECKGAALDAAAQERMKVYAKDFAGMIDGMAPVDERDDLADAAE
jgi:hypothetical protein